MLKIAIVGNIAAGKSTVESILQKKGFSVYDTDILSHEILEKEKQEIIKVFSDFDILDEDGKISRTKLGEIVFSNFKYKIDLEKIIYPKLEAELNEIFEKNSDKEFVFVSVPLLFEVNWESKFDKIIFIEADDKVRLARLTEERKFPKGAALKRMNAQVPQEEKIGKSHFIICNNSDITSLQKKIDEIIILLEDVE